MRKIFIVAAIVVTYTFDIQAQSIRGACVHVNGGAAVHFSPSMQRDLRSTSLLGMDLQLNRAAAVVGVSGLALFPNRVLLGVSAVGYRVSGATERGEAVLSMAGAFLNAGYLLSFNNRVMSFLFIGAGVNGTILKLTNETKNETFAIRNQVVSPGEFKKFGSRGINFDAGYTLQFLAFSKQDRLSKRGVMIGTQIGALIFAGMEDWREASSEQSVPSLAQALSFSPYIRMTIGLGSFKLQRLRSLNPGSYRF